MDMMISKTTHLHFAKVSLNNLQTHKDLYDIVQYCCYVPDNTLFVFRKPYTKVDSNQQQDCPSTVNETLLSVRTPGDVPQVSILSLHRCL
jgi:hypothetical protein